MIRKILKLFSKKSKLSVEDKIALSNKVRGENIARYMTRSTPK